MNKSRTEVFDVQAFLDSAGLARKIVEYPRKATIFTQGNSSNHVMYIQEGGVKLSVVNAVGKEAVVAILRQRETSSAKYVCRDEKISQATATAITLPRCSSLKKTR